MERVKWLKLSSFACALGVVIIQAFIDWERTISCLALAISAVTLFLLVIDEVEK
jgi:hypothetical protein